LNLGIERSYDLIDNKSLLFLKFGESRNAIEK